MALDTGPLIYWLERNPKYFDICNRSMNLIETRHLRACTSTLTLTELLVLPYRLQDWERADRIYATLGAFPHLEWVPPTFEIADRAARIRAEHNLKTPEAIQAATALAAGASGLIANDEIFRRVPGLDVLLLDEML